MNDFWIWLVIGLIPYYIKEKRIKNERTFEVRAPCWSLDVCLLQGKRYQWTLSIPLIERLQKAIRAAMVHLREDKHQQD